MRTLHATQTSRCTQKSIFDASKRAFDVVAGALLLVLFTPLLLVVALLVKRDSKGPALFRQVRVGRNNSTFFIYKFRTMYADADQSGPQITSSDDSRITRIGRYLRGCKLDELPQLLNVVRGDMSLVGPRPQVPRFVNEFPPDLREIVLAVRPGITGPTQLRYRNEEEMLEGRPDREQFYIDHLMPAKCRMDVDYVERRSLWTDAAVLAETGWLLVRGVYLRVVRPEQLRAAAAGAAIVRDDREKAEALR